MKRYPGIRIEIRRIVCIKLIYSVKKVHFYSQMNRVSWSNIHKWLYIHSTEHSKHFWNIFKHLKTETSSVGVVGSTRYINTYWREYVACSQDSWYNKVRPTNAKKKIYIYLSRIYYPFFIINTYIFWNIFCRCPGCDAATGTSSRREGRRTLRKGGLKHLL